MSQQQIVLPSNEGDLIAIKKVLSEICNSYTRIDSEKEYIKDAINDLSEKYSLPKRQISKLVRFIHKNNLDEQTQEIESIDYMYSSLFKTNMNEDAEKSIVEKDEDDF